MSATSASAAPIEFDGVVKRFGKRTVLDGLSFTVPEGSVVGLLGPNGAGKSTAMRVLLGLQKASAGHARINGHEPGSPGFRSAVRKVGSIIEAPPVYKNVSPMANLAIRIAATGLSIDDAEVRVILNQVGLSERADDKVGDFSLGMRQRLGIALALVGRPSIVVLDEPTNGLDPEGSVEVRNLISSLPDRGATVLVCTHRLQEIELTCDYVVVLQGGKLVTQGSLDDVVSAASGQGLSVTVASEDVERALRILQASELFGDVSIDDHHALTTTRGADDPAAATRALAAQGIYLTGLHGQRATLEEAFLEITERGRAAQEEGS